MSVTVTLRERLEAACTESGLSMRALSVLSKARDPYRLDTEAGHRAGKWLAEQVARLGVRTPIHLRGLFYVLVAAADVKKPGGEPFTNTDENWTWLADTAAKAARWLKYLPWESITDERNGAPVIYTTEHADAGWSIGINLNVGVPMLEVLPPSGFSLEAEVHCYSPRQPYRFVLIGEKTSLAAVLEPVARRYEATLALPAGEISDTLLHQLVKASAADGRPTVIFYFADCDPSGHQMPISVARKVQALRDLKFPELAIEVQSVALTVEQVKRYGLPSTPLKDTERRADKWKAAFGVEQTEIDALTALRPDLLRRLAEEAIKPYWDETLNDRTWRVRREYRKQAEAVLEAHADHGAIAELRANAKELQAEADEVIDELNDKIRDLRIEEDRLLEDLRRDCPLPPPPEVPQPEVTANPRAEPIYSSDWDWAEATQRLRERKAYENGEE